MLHLNFFIPSQIKIICLLGLQATHLKLIHVLTRSSIDTIIRISLLSFINLITTHSFKSIFGCVVFHDDNTTRVAPNHNIIWKTEQDACTSAVNTDSFLTFNKLFYQADVGSASWLSFKWMKERIRILVTSYPMFSSSSTLPIHNTSLYQILTKTPHFDQFPLLSNRTGFLHFLNKKIPWLLNMNSITFFAIFGSFLSSTHRTIKNTNDPINDL